MTTWTRFTYSIELKWELWRSLSRIWDFYNTMVPYNLLSLTLMTRKLNDFFFNVSLSVILLCVLARLKRVRYWHVWFSYAKQSQIYVADVVTAFFERNKFIKNLIQAMNLRIWKMIRVAMNKSFIHENFWSQFQKIYCENAKKLLTHKLS